MALRWIHGRGLREPPPKRFAGAEKIGSRVGRILQQYKMGKSR